MRNVFAQSLNPTEETAATCENLDLPLKNKLKFFTLFFKKNFK